MFLALLYIGIAVVFPVVFSINAAYHRREEALRALANIKGNMFAMRLSYAHWSTSQRSTDAADTAACIISDADEIISTFFNDLKTYLTNHSVDTHLEENVLYGFSSLSRLTEKLRENGVASPEISRVNEYLRIMMVHFEVMKTIKVYRTPVVMRGFTKFFLTVFPVLYGPVFAYIANEAGTVGVGIVLATLYAIVLTALDYTQEILESPYAGDIDDIQFFEPSMLLSTKISREESIKIFEKSHSDMSNISDIEFTVNG